MSYYELETQQGLLPVRLGRWSVKSDYPSTNLWDYVYAPRVRGGLVRCEVFSTAYAPRVRGGLGDWRSQHYVTFAYAPRVRGGFVGLGFNAQT